MDTIKCEVLEGKYKGKNIIVELDKDVLKSKVSVENEEGYYTELRGVLSIDIHVDANSIPIVIIKAI